MQTIGDKIPKWNPRARLRVYLGQSPCHTGNVALVLNPEILYVSPQYHVVFDADFYTVPFQIACDISTSWSVLVKNGTESVTDEDFDLVST